VGTNRISGIALQRRRPMNVFVDLDDPEANSFIRDGKQDKKSPKEKKKLLEKQLKAAREYLKKMFGEGMPNGAIEISDYDIQSFVDIVSDARNPMGTGDQAFDREMTVLLASPIVQAAASKGIAALATLVGGVETAKQIMKAINNSSRSSSAGMGTYGETSQQAREREAADKKLADAEARYGADSDEAIEARRERSDTLTRHKRERRSKTGSTTGDARRQREAKQEAAKKAREERLRRNQEATNRENEEKIRRGKQRERRGRIRTSEDEVQDLLRGETYEPEGKVIKEKKSFKDITKKIPGYYDGKPSLLGFPLEEPPKMVNGYHPDLVDGKKVANRFNRLDPQSAKAMPKTGNPHIDKKVRAAAKKPK